MTQHVAHRKSDEIAASIAAERKRLGMKLNKTAEEWAKLPSYCVGFLGQAQQDIATLHAEIARLKDLLYMGSMARDANYASREGLAQMMHSSTYEYLKPTDQQIDQMAKVRAAAKAYNDVLDAVLPDGPDKTYIIRTHRSNAMWANVAITRLPDGTPR